MNTIVKTNYIKNTRFITTIKFLFYTFLYFMPVILYLSENSHTRIAQAATPKFQNKYSKIMVVKLPEASEMFHNHICPRSSAG